MSRSEGKEARAFRKELEQMVWAARHPSYKKMLDGKRYIEIYRKGQGNVWEPMSSISTDDLITTLSSASQRDFEARRSRSHMSKGISAAEAAGARDIVKRRLAALRANGEDKRKTAAWREALAESAELERRIAFSNWASRSRRSHSTKRIKRDRGVIEVMGGYNVDLDRGGKLVRESLPALTPGKDYGADPLGDGTFRMVPSGDIVSFEERNRRLSPTKRSHATKRSDDGRSISEAAAAGDSFQVETMDGKHHLYMPGSRGVKETLRNVRRHWKHRIGQRVRIYRVLPGSRIGAMMLEEHSEATL